VRPVIGVHSTIDVLPFVLNFRIFVIACLPSGWTILRPSLWLKVLMGWSTVIVSLCRRSVLEALGSIRSTKENHPSPAQGMSSWWDQLPSIDRTPLQSEGYVAQSRLPRSIYQGGWMLRYKSVIRSLVCARCLLITSLYPCSFLSISKTVLKRYLPVGCTWKNVSIGVSDWRAKHHTDALSFVRCCRL